MAERQANPTVQASSMDRYLQQAGCSSDASIGDVSENVGAAERQHREDEQASDGSKRSADDECNVTPATLAAGAGDGAAVGASGKRLKVQHSRALTEDEKAQRRREGNRKAAQRLRQRRMETVAKLEEEVAKLEQERLVYLNHMYQLAASARSVVEENRALRARLGVTAASPAQTVAKPPLPVPAKHASPLPGHVSSPPLPSMASVNSACMDFEAVRRELFSNSGAAVWPGPGL
ncbi:hypothetical protein WJX81_005279 [Elliptochloris bilobata]|uniref:BZIP domain-containing protein n=1 Tax=Elliptochloris bilobata TaxID=381761 RepID=A0AAW1S6B4_9CHLO